MSSKVQNVNESQFEEFFNSDKTFVVDFWAEWCGPCKMIAPLYNEIAEELSSVDFIKVNVDTDGDIAGRFGVRGIPTILVIKDKKVVGSKVGALTKENLKQFIKDNL